MLLTALSVVTLPVRSVASLVPVEILGKVVVVMVVVVVVVVVGMVVGMVATFVKVTAAFLTL